MNWMESVREIRTPDVLKDQRAAWLVLWVSVLLTGFAWWITHYYVEAAVRHRFELRVLEIQQRLNRGLKDSQTVVRAAAGFVNASDDVRPDEWQRFIDVLITQESSAGLLGVGYMPWLPAAGLDAHQRRMRAGRYPAYQVYPPGERDFYAPIAYFDPENDANRGLIGFDAYSDPVRRGIIDHARDIGEPALSPMLELAIDDPRDRKGFIFYMPVYDEILPHATIPERRQALRGYTLSAFRAEPFFRGMGLGELSGVELEIFEGNEPKAERLLFDNDPAGGISALASPAAGDWVRFEIQNRPTAWSVYAKPRGEFRTDSERFLPGLVLLGALLVDFMLFITVWVLGRNRRDLEHLSEALKAQLQESEQVLRSAIEAMGEAFVIYDADDRLVYCNERYREIYHRSAPAIQIGRTFEEIIRYGVERGQYADAVGHEEAWVAERLAKHRAADTEIVQKLDDGRWIRIRERRTPSGHIIGIRIDLTEIYLAKEAAEAASRAKSRFLATVSHEIRTPMNGILGTAQLLQDPELSPATRDAHVRTILRAGQALLALLNDILDLSKVEAGRLELFPVAFSPAGLLNESVQLFLASASNKGLTLSGQSQIPPGKRYLGDADRLRQMLSNLIGNAVKFTHAGKITVNVGMVPEKADELLFSVLDSGPGIAAELQARLFEPFTQIDDSSTRQHGGTGLGLSIVRQLARLMGGDAGVESAPGEGARFWFRVPVSPVAGSASTPPKEPPLARGWLADRHLQGRVLVAEDNPTHRLIIASTLGRLGLDYVEVADGQAALERIMAGENFDLILMDLQMPVMDGLAAMAALTRWCAEREQPLPKVVAITALAYESDRSACLAAGMVEVITKPIDVNDLATVLTRYLPERAASGAVPAPLDAGRALGLIEQLLPLLAEQRFDAFASFRELKALLAETRLAERLAVLEGMLNRMEFDPVYTDLRQLKVELETGDKA